MSLTFRRRSIAVSVVAAYFFSTGVAVLREALYRALARLRRSGRISAIESGGSLVLTLKRAWREEPLRTTSGQARAGEWIRSLLIEP